MQAPFRNQPLLTPAQLTSRLGELYRAIEEYNEGYYFASHETLETLWMVTPWPERQLLQAIIQLAAAFVHLVRGEYPGVIKLLDASATKLRDFLPECLGVQTAALAADIAAVREDLATLGPARFREFDEACAPKIAVRGFEDGLGRLRDED